MNNWSNQKFPQQSGGETSSPFPFQIHLHCDDSSIIKELLLPAEETQPMIDSHTQRRIAADLAAQERGMQPIQSAHSRDTYYNRRATISDDRPLTSEELAEINAFWKPYEFAYKNDPEVQRVFSRMTGRFDPSYIGFGLMRYVLRNWYSHSTYVGICHKNYLDRIFPFVKQPYAFIHRSYGHYFDHDHLPITKEEAVNICYNTLHGATGYQEMIIKPADTTGEGKNATFFDADASKEKILQIFDAFTQDFICQEVLKNHPTLAAPHPESLNTLRIVTLMWKDTVYHVGTVFRMGLDKRIDNLSQGGIGCQVFPGGVCGDLLTDYYGKHFTEHPSGFKVAGHRLFHADEAVKQAMLCHETMPQQKYVAWDFTIDQDGDPVLIEIKSPGGTEAVQICGINALIDREMAKEILDEYLIRRFFYERANNDYDYREFADHVSLIKYRGQKTGDITVPKFINNKPVKMIYKDTFISPKISKITIPYGIYLEQSDFSRCAKGCEIIRI